MKRFFVLALVMSLLMLTAVGCKNNEKPASGSASDVKTDITQSDAERENTSSQISDSVSGSSKPQESSDNSQGTQSEADSDNDESNTQSSASDSDNASSDNGSNTGSITSSVSENNCDHKNERHEYKSATCTENGYDKYTCEKCGNIRTEVTAAKGHKFSEYICLECGIADKKNALSALNRWIELNGERKDESSQYEYTFSSDKGSYTLSSFQKQFKLSFLSSSEEEAQEQIYIEILDSENCNITYYLDGEMVDIPVKITDVLSENADVWKKLSLSEGIDAAKYRESLHIATVSVLDAFEDSAPAIELALTLEDFGFKQA